MCHARKNREKHGKLTDTENYESALNQHDTQVAIKTVKDCFQDLLAERLNLLRVPLRSS